MFARSLQLEFQYERAVQVSVSSIGTLGVLFTMNQEGTWGNQSMPASSLCAQDRPGCLTNTAGLSSVILEFCQAVSTVATEDPAPGYTCSDKHHQAGSYKP